MSIQKHIPNFLTICNLSSGIAGILLLFHHQPVEAAIMIWVGAVFDFMDGFAARLLKTSSPIGKELDSLADVITFGLLPAFIVYELIARQFPGMEWLAYGAFLIAICSALRLAKFNVDERQSTSFLGLPTPASAIAVSALPFYQQHSHFQQFITPYSLAFLILALSFLMVSETKLFSLKFKDISWAKDKWKIIFLGISLLCFVGLKILSLPFIILLYIIFSVIDNISKKM